MLSVHRYYEISESTHFASRFGTTGVGVDIHPPLIEAKARARGLGVEHAVEFPLGDGAASDLTGRMFDMVASIGASWVDGGPVGTFDLMRAVAADDARAQNV